MVTLLIKSSFIIIILLAFYKLFLEKESYFAINRIYLLACLGLAFSLPFIALPQLIEHQGYAETLIQAKQPINSTTTESNLLEIKATPFPKKEAIEISRPTKKVKPTLEKIDKEKAANQLIVQDNNKVKRLKGTLIRYLQENTLVDWLLLFYGFGVVVLLFNLLAQLGNMVFKIIRNEDKIIDDDGIIVNMNAIIEPCSFFNYIFINPASYDYASYEQIIAHEKIHVQKRHTFDLLLAELAVIVLWFNPFIWLFRKEVEKNIEYQTDDFLVNHIAAEKENYQMNLLKIATYNKPLTIVTNYNQSLIKQRILKMNSKKSTPYSYWKYVFIAPLLFSLLLFLNKPVMVYAKHQKGTIEFSNEPLSTNLTPAINEKNQTSVKTTPKKEEINVVEEAKLKDHRLTGTNNSRYDDKVKVEDNRLDKYDYDNDCQLLLQAVRTKDNDKVKELLKTIDPNCVNPKEEYEERKVNGHTWRTNKARTPLVAAARNGNFEGGKLLLAAGAKVNFHHKQDESALIAAAENGHLDFVKYLLQNGADLDENSNAHGSPLNAAARKGHSNLVDYLINKGADIDASTNGQGSALNAAARNGHNETIKRLLAKGANIDEITNGQGSALNAAARNGHIATVKLLVEKGANIDLQNNGQGSALNAAARNGNVEVVELLIAKGADLDVQNNGQGSALNAAARNGNVEMVKLLIAKGADLDVQNNGQGSTLNAAARNGNTEMVKLLIDAGANLDISTNGQGSALNAAARNGRIEMVKLLLSKGANINEQTNGQGSALNAAARNGHNEMLKLLLEKGADVDLQNNGQGTALNAAARNGHLATAKLLLANDADVNVMSNGQGTALMAATRNGQYQLVELLLKNGADPYLSPNHQESPNDRAHKDRDKRMIKLFDTYKKQ